MPHWGSWPERGSASLTRQAGCIREGHLIEAAGAAVVRPEVPLPLAADPALARRRIL